MTERIETLGAGEGADEKLVRALKTNVEVEVLKGLEGPLHTIVHNAIEAALAKVGARPERREGSAPRARNQNEASEPKQVAEVKAPKEGGLCAAVWSELDKIQNRSGAVPTLKEIMKVGKRKSWNANNTRAEYYRWRRSHGITGRLAATA